MGPTHARANHARGLAIVAILVTQLALLSGLAPTARADLQPGSRHPLRVHDRIAMPLPSVVRAPVLTRLSHGRLRVTVRMRFLAANWRGIKGVARDRVLVTFYVARRLLTAGPDPAAPLFHKLSVGLLRQRVDINTYSVVLPARVGSFLAAQGVFSSRPARRERALRLVWVDVEQERDYLHVDGSYDWREGRAANAADASSPGGRLAFPASANDSCGTSEPCGTLTVQNQTANGVYGPTDSYSDGAGLPGTMSGTLNAPAVPIVVGGTALQCFESGAENSNPTGFENAGSDGDPQQYIPGTVSGSSDLNDVQSSGTAVTEPIQANDTISFASNNEVADASGLVQGVMSVAGDLLGWGLGLPKNSPTGGYGLNIAGLGMMAVSDSSLPIPSPGAIVSGSLSIAEFIVANSCDGTPNLMGLGVAEPGGAVNAAAIEAQKGIFEPYSVQISGSTPGSGQYAYGEQMNPSQSYFNGSQLYLQQDLSGGGVQGTSTPDNFDDVIWTNYNPCQITTTGYIGVDAVPGLDTCNVTPASSPTVTSSVGNVNCGSGNTACPFPAANFPSGTPTTFRTAAFAASPPSGPPATTTLYTSSCGVYITALPGGNALASGQSISSPNGLFTLTMQSNGELVEMENAYNGSSARELWNSTQAPTGWSTTVQSPNGLTAGSYAALQASGSLVILPPTGLSPSFSTNTPVHPQEGASFNSLTVQNDGNVVVYDADTAVWASNTNVATCSSPGPNQPPLVKPTTTTDPDGCATNLASSASDYEPSSTITSPNGEVQLTMAKSGSELRLTAYGQQVWTSGAGPPPASSFGPPQNYSYFSMQTDGNLVIYSPTGGGALWATNTSPNSGTWLAVQNDGNLVLYGAGGTVLWATTTSVAPYCPNPG